MLISVFSICFFRFLCYNRTKSRSRAGSLRIYKLVQSPDGGRRPFRLCRNTQAPPASAAFGGLRPPPIPLHKPTKNLKKEHQSSHGTHPLYHQRSRLISGNEPRYVRFPRGGAPGQPGYLHFHLPGVPGRQSECRRPHDRGKRLYPGLSAAGTQLLQRTGHPHHYDRRAVPHPGGERSAHRPGYSGISFLPLS